MGYRDRTKLPEGDPYYNSKTEAQWQKEGRVVVGTGETFWTNAYRRFKKIYYMPEETRPATPEELSAWEAAQRAHDRERRQEKRKAKQAEAEREKARLEALMARLRRYIDLDPASIICLDTETTGVSPGDEILQLSIMDGRGEVLFNEYIRPTAHETWPEAQRIHGITPEMVADKPTIAEYLPRITEIIGNARLIVGYNMQFDLSFLRRAHIRVPKETNTFDVMFEFAEIYGEWNDYFQDYRWQKLCVCADYFGYEGSAFHDSLEDVRATLFCYFAMTKYDPTEDRTTA